MPIKKTKRTKEAPAYAFPIFPDSKDVYDLEVEDILPLEDCLDKKGLDTRQEILSAARRRKVRKVSMLIRLISPNAAEPAWIGLGETLKLNFEASVMLGSSFNHYKLTYTNALRLNSPRST